MNVTEAIETRFSIRQYQPEMVPMADIREILRLTGLAPSAWNLQPWRMVVVTEPSLKEKIAQAGYNQTQFVTAPVVIAVVADGEDMMERLDQTAHPGLQNDPLALERYKTGIRNALGKQSVEDRAKWAAGQTYIALGYLSIAARGLGYDTALMLGFDAKKVKELLQLPDHVAITALVTLGKRDQSGYEHHRHQIDQITKFM